MSHYVTAALRTDDFDPSRLPEDLETTTGCSGKSGGARRFLEPTARLNCWIRTDPTDLNDWFFVLWAADEKILLYKRRDYET